MSKILLNRRLSLSVAILLLCVLVGANMPVSAFAEEDMGEESVIPSGGAWPSGPEIGADAAIVIEQTTGLILYAKNIYEQHYPASTTKVLTTLVALENSNLNDMITVSYEAENYVSKSSSRMGLVEGEQLTMEEALYGVMLESANEGTYAVGEQVSGSIAKFIKQMNIKAAELGCVNSHFANSHGLHDDEHYTCAYDMALIAQAAFNNETFRKITGTATYVMAPTNKNPERVMVNHHNFINRTIKYDYCIGGKTGATNQAGYCLVTYAKKDGMTLVSVVMHADTWDDVYADSRTVLDFAFENYDIYDMAEADGNKETSTMPSLFSESAGFVSDDESNLRLSNDGKIILPNGVSLSQVDKSIDFYNDIVIEHGENTIGAVSYNFDGRVVGKSDIIFFNEEYPLTDKSFVQRWPSYLKPLGVVFGEENRDSIPTYSERMLAKAAAEEDVDYTPLYIGIAAGVVVLGIGGLILKKKFSGR